MIFGGIHEHSCSGPLSYEMLNVHTHVADSGLLMYDIHYYGINLEVSDTSTYLSGYTDILATALGATDELVFELNDQLQVDSVFIGGLKTDLYTHENSLIRIAAQLPLQKDERFMLRVCYKGAAGQTGFFSGISNRTDVEWGNRVTYTLSEPFRALDWFVCKQVLDDKADSADINITVDQGLMAGSNGVLAGIDSLPGNKLRYRWRSRYPIAYYLLSLSVSKYQDYSLYAKLDSRTDSILIQNFIYNEETYLEQHKEQIDATADLIRFYSGIFSEYPFLREKYGHSLAPMGGGMEHQTMTTLSSFSFTLVAHELTHQWYGNNVTCASWQDIWVHEGFASYGEYLALEELKSPEEARAWMDQAHEWAMSDPVGSVYIPEKDAEDAARIFSRALSYKKGASLLHMIRYELGDDSIFFETLSRFQVRFADSVATGRDFLDVLNETSGSNFDWFFDQWYYGQGFPMFEFTWWQTGDSVIIEILQSPSSENTPFFKTRLDLALQIEQGGDTLIGIICDRPYMRVGVRSDRLVSGLVPDPDNWVLDRSQVLKKIISNGYFTVGPNPFGDELNIVFQSGIAKREIQLCDISGKVLEKHSSRSGTFTLDTHYLRQGLYLLQVKEGNESYTTKVIRH